MQELADALTLQDRLTLSALLSSKNDPFRQLPAELVIHIFDYLPLFEAWRLQVVCKTWQSVLSSEEVQRAILSRWDTHDPAESARPLEQQSVNDKLRHIQAWRLGLPSSTASIQRSPGSHEELGTRNRDSQAPRTLALEGKTLAFLDSDPSLGDTVVIRDLLGKAPDYKLKPGGRERIMGITLTPKLVACLTFHGKMYVQALAPTQGAPKTVRLPSSIVTAFHADGNTIGLIVGSSSKSSDLLLYNHATGRMIQQSIEYPASFKTAPDETMNLLPPNAVPGTPQPPGYDEMRHWKSPRSMLVDEATGNVDVFYEVFTGIQAGYDPAEGYHVKFLWLAHQRYHITTAQQPRSGRACPAQEDSMRVPYQWSDFIGEGLSGALHFPNRTGRRFEWAFSAYLLRGEEPLACMVPIFEAEQGKLRIENYALPPDGLSPHYPRRLSIWKDILLIHCPSGTLTHTIEEEAAAEEGLPK